MTPGKPITCPVLIGRSDYLEVIEGCLSQVDRLQILSIAGSAGIGKSRLVEEARTSAARRGMLVLEAHCFELDRSLPYAPWIDLLQAFVSSCTLEDVARTLEPVAGELARLLPELAAHLPASALSVPLAPEQEKRRLILAIARWLEQLARRQSLLVILEDVHWSDDTSLELLPTLMHRLRDQPILFLITYRPEEASSTLTHCLAEVDRWRLGVEMELKPLTRGEVDEMLRALAHQDRPVHRTFLDPIYTLTEGNPFFIEEIVKSLMMAGELAFADEGWDRKPLGELHTPRSVQDSVRWRLAQLDAPARRLLTLAAVAGRRFDFALLQSLTQQDENALLLWIKEALAAQLVIEESAEQFAFRHALTRQAIYSELLVRERRRLHQLVLEAMEERRTESSAPAGAEAGSDLPDLAYHAYAAAQWEKALKYTEHAGARAQALNAPREAAEHFTRALDAARRLALPPPARLLRARGQVYELLGSFTSAYADYERALNAAHAAGDGVAEWQCLIDLGFLWSGRDYERTGQYFRGAIELAKAMDDPKLRGHSLNRMGNWLVNTGEAEQGLQAHRQALNIFESERDQAGVAATHDLIGMANALYGDMAEASWHSQRAIELFHELGDKRGPVSAIAVLNADAGFAEPVHWTARSVDECQQDSSAALTLARQLDWPAGQAQTEWSTAVALGALGELGQGLAHGREALRITQEIEHPQWTAAAYSALGQIYTWLLQPLTALHYLEAGLPLARDLGSAYWLGNITTYLALVYLQQGKAQAAQAALAAVISQDQAPRNLPQRRLAWAWSEVLLAQNQSAEALQVVEQLLKSAPGTYHTQPIPALCKVKGQALAALGRFDEAERTLGDAVRGALERGAHPLLWQIHAEFAGFYRRIGQEEAADRELQASRKVIQLLAATIDDEPLRESFTRAALEKLPGAKPLTPLRAAKVQFGGLTAREREVAASVAQGKSSHRIADELVLSERTVENHIGNILTKLGFVSRAQIAVWAVENGLRKEESTE